MLKRIWTVIALLASMTACGSRKTETNKTAAVAAQEKPVSGVGCLGRILPENGTFFVSPDTVGGHAPVLEQVEIKAGEEVAPGQVIAVMSSQRDLQAAVKEAEARLGLARERLARAKAAPLPEESAVVEAEIARFQVQRDAADRDFRRNKPLYDKDFISRAQLDGLEARVTESDALITQARQRLKAVGKIRPEDTAIAEAEVRIADAELARLRQEVSSSVVRAPSRARVLRVIGHAGELVGPQGIAELAETGRMAVIAEVYESDIARVHLGQKAAITSELLPHPLTGEVAWIAPQIETQQPLSAEPGAPSDARVFKVRLSVAEQSILADRINGQVKIVIQP